MENLEILTIIGRVSYGVLLVILGLNAVILVHELGHFLVARWCGVRVDKFYIWFDFWGLKFFKFKWGETEYGLGLFPLGGYVKMLGQEDNPGAIQAEIERARLAKEGQVTQEKAKEWTGVKALEADGLVDAKEATEMVAHLETKPTSESQVADIAIFAPDSYLSKNVPQRLAIIVAGVIMNFLFAIICATAAYMYGVTESAPAVGNVIPGSPAWEAGLQTGDKITAINGTTAREFKDVNKKMIEGTRTIQLTIEREGESQVLDVSPRRRSGDLVPNIGVESLLTLELHPQQRLGRREKYYSAETLDVLRTVTDTNPAWLEKVDGQAVNSYAEYQEAQLKRIGESITGTIGGVDVEIPAVPMRAIPVRFQMGTIAAVLPGSDAYKKGIKEGDTIVSVDGDADFDPLKLPQVLLRKVNAGQATVELVIRKAEDGYEQTLTLELAPVRILPGLSPGSMRDSVSSTALGLSWNVDPVVADVDETALLPGQPVPAIGDRLVSVEFVNGTTILRGNSFSDTTRDGVRFHSIGERVDVPYIFAYMLQVTPLREGPGSLQRILVALNLSEPPAEEEVEKGLFVRLVLESPDETTKIIELPILEATDWFQLERGISLRTEVVVFQAAHIGEALALGTARTVRYTLLVYTSLRSLLDGTVSPRALNGPVGIVEFLYRFALMGWVDFLILLCLIGANLAVINMLPIPPLDGGHVLFLVYEWIFGRPPNELVQVILSYAGLLMILALMVWTVSLDLACIPRW